MSTVKEEQAIAKKVNQWFFRSWSNKTFMCEFWFNNGDLDAQTLKRFFGVCVEECPKPFAEDRFVDSL